MVDKEQTVRPYPGTDVIDGQLGSSHGKITCRNLYPIFRYSLPVYESSVYHNGQPEGNIIHLLPMQGKHDFSRILFCRKDNALFAAFGHLLFRRASFSPREYGIV